MKVYFLKSDVSQFIIFPEPENLEDYFLAEVEDESELESKSAVVFKGKFRLVEKCPSEDHEWNGKSWVISKEKMTALLTEQRERVFAQIVTKRDECVNGGAYVERIGKWVDSDEKGRATLVEIKADFDLNGKDNTYTLICSDNTAYTLNFDEFKSVWDAVKTLKEKMFENAYMHQILLEQAENPLEYDWSIGWSKTYEESKN
ncbi:hypothetical protein BKG93_04515 [Rodentibacter ratti]|uniref:DUF4376 domain-containing protein n=1 Tax=Rodentibacter ratti TaxID=1906745 RepID=A0A1V3L6J3_9PAST|nr:DUF4376 domain-containing protein [Rodentibacter ratti]OOF85485.1 hypothetical protein BKG93_04515 [Rodentibacter ratti]